MDFSTLAVVPKKFGLLAGTFTVAMQILKSLKQVTSSLALLANHIPGLFEAALFGGSARLPSLAYRSSWRILCAVILYEGQRIDERTACSGMMLVWTEGKI